MQVNLSKEDYSAIREALRIAERTAELSRAKAEYRRVFEMLAVAKARSTTAAA